MVPFYGWVSTASRLEPLRGGSLLFTTKFPEIWYSFYRPRKDERLSRPWSHPVVLSAGPLDWESGALTTRPYTFNVCTFKEEYFGDFNHAPYITAATVVCFVLRGRLQFWFCVSLKKSEKTSSM